MKHIILAVAILAAGTAYGQKPVRYTDSADTFSATFPTSAPVDFKFKQANANDGTAYSSDRYEQDEPNDSMYLAVVHGVYATNRGNTTAMLDGVIDKSLARVGVIQRSSRKRDSTIGRLPARAGYGVVVKDGIMMTVYIRITTEGNQLWMLIAVVREGSPYGNQDAEHFFDSVEIKS